VDRKKVLIVDDEGDIRDFLKQRLLRHKYEAITASSGKEAPSICKMNRPDLVLLDIAMPELDGYETCKIIKQDIETKDIPILLLTGKELEPKGIIERCKELGAQGYISKLSRFEDLLAKIKEVIG